MFQLVDTKSKLTDIWAKLNMHQFLWWLFFVLVLDNLKSAVARCIIVMFLRYAMNQYITKLQDGTNHTHRYFVIKLKLKKLNKKLWAEQEQKFWWTCNRFSTATAPRLCTIYRACTENWTWRAIKPPRVLASPHQILCVLGKWTVENFCTEREHNGASGGVFDKRGREPNVPCSAAANVKYHSSVNVVMEHWHALWAFWYYWSK